MNTATKVVVALVVILAIALGAYYLMSQPSAQAPAPSAMEEGGVAPATGSVDDFAAAMQSELAASAAAIKAFDVSVDAAASNVQSTVTSGTQYDPNNI